MFIKVIMGGNFFLHVCRLTLQTCICSFVPITCLQTFEKLVCKLSKIQKVCRLEYVDLLQLQVDKLSEVSLQTFFKCL